MLAKLQGRRSCERRAPAGAIVDATLNATAIGSNRRAAFTGPALSCPDPRERCDRVTAEMDPVKLYRIAYRIRLVGNLTPGREAAAQYLENRAAMLTIEQAQARRAARATLPLFEDEEEEFLPYRDRLRESLPSVLASIALLAILFFAAAWSLLAAGGAPR